MFQLTFRKNIPQNNPINIFVKKSLIVSYEIHNELKAEDR